MASSHKISALFVACFATLALVSPVVGYDITETSSKKVSATVPEQQFNPPILLAPSNNSTTNDGRMELSWQRPSPLPATPLHHYDFYLDGVVFASSVPDSLTTSDYYYYSLRRDGDIFYLKLKTDIGEGYHTWKVVAYNSSGLSSESETWTFYLDTVSPEIILKSVDTNSMSWSSKDSSTIPSIDQRVLYVTKDPLLSGTVEAYANLQFTLLCPTDVSTCSSLSQTFNYASGQFQHRFYGLIPNKAYPVILTATDTAGNTTTLPTFYLVYFTGGTVLLVTPTVLVSPPSLPTLPTLPSATPPINLVEIILPTEFIPITPPEKPLPPPAVIPPAKTTFNPWPLLFFLLVLGLPLHLAMSQFGNLVPYYLTPQFIFILLYPFLRKSNAKTLPYTHVEIYNEKNFYRHLVNSLTDFAGRYYLPTPLPKSCLVILKSKNRNWKPTLFEGEKLPTLCFFPNLQDPETRLKRLSDLSLSLRSLPLGIAIITSGIALFLSPNYFYLLYFYLSLQALYSEYFYPKSIG